MSLPLSVHRRMPKRLPLSLGFKKYALSFDGVDDYVEVPHSDVLNLNGLTVESWFRSTFSGAWLRTIVSKFGYTLIRESWGLGWMDTNKLGFYIRDAAGVRNIAAAALGEGLDGKWHHLVGVASSTVVQFWIDGVLKAQVDRTAGDIRNTRPVTIGMHLYQYVPEDVGGVRIYSRALSEEEIRYNVLNYHSPVRDGLVLWLHDKIVGNTWYDESGLGNNGTIYGAVRKNLSMWELRSEAGL